MNRVYSRNRHVNLTSYSSFHTKINYGSFPEGEVSPVDTEKVFWRYIIGGLLSTRLQQAVLLNSIKEKCEGVRGWGLS